MATTTTNRQIEHLNRSGLRGFCRVASPVSSVCFRVCVSLCVCETCVYGSMGEIYINTDDVDTKLSIYVFICSMSINPSRAIVPN